MPWCTDEWYSINQLSIVIAHTLVPHVYSYHYFTIKPLQYLIIIIIIITEILKFEHGFSPSGSDIFHLYC